MSKSLSLKLKDDVFRETEVVVKRLRVPRNTYINEAVSLYNHLHERRELRVRLAHESELVRAESLAVLAEMEAMEERPRR